MSFFFLLFVAAVGLTTLLMFAVGAWPVGIALLCAMVYLYNLQKI